MSLLLAKECRSVSPASALFRMSVRRPRASTYGTLEQWTYSTRSGSSPYSPDRKSSTVKYDVATASSSASQDFLRSRLQQSISFNKRLQRSVEAMEFHKKRNWRVTAAILDVVIGYLDKADHLSSSAADFLFRSCGRLTPAAPAQKRIQYLKTLWNNLPRLGLAHDLGAYTRLQQMLLQNRQTFSASGFLDQVRKAGYAPNAFLYLGSIIRCDMDEKPNLKEINHYFDCIHKTTTDPEILTKTHGAMVSAYARAGDVDKLRSFLEEAKADETPSGILYLNQYYFSCASIAAQRGDAMAMFKLIDAARRDGVFINDFQYLYLARCLVLTGRQDSLLRILNYMPKEHDWIYRTLPFVLTLIADGQYVAALTVLQRSAAATSTVAVSPVVPPPDSVSPDEMIPRSENVYHFLMDLFYLNLPPAQITAFCRRLNDCGYTDEAFQLAAVAAYDAKREDIAQQMLAEAYQHSSASAPRESRAEGENKSVEPPLRQRHFVAALRTRALLGDLHSVLTMLERLVSEIGPAGFRLLSSNVLRFFYSSVLDADMLFSVFGTFASRRNLLTAIVCVCLRETDGQKARSFLQHFLTMPLVWHKSPDLTNALSVYYQKTYDSQLISEILQRIATDPKVIGKVLVSDPCTFCAEAVYRDLSLRLCQPELNDFVNALENAGIRIQPERCDLKVS